MRTTRRTVLGIIGSGNVFADLGLPDPETLSVKGQRVIKIGEAIEKRGLTEARAARIMGMPRRELAELLRGHTMHYTIDGLEERLRRLSR